MARLDDKVAIITGAARGQGEAEARLFAREGAKVVLGDILDEEGTAVAKDIGSAATYVHLDVSDEAQWAGAIEAAAAFGALTVLVNNAAIIRPKAIEDTSLADYMSVISINQVGCFLGMRSAAAPMKAAGGGSIVNVSSIDGMRSTNGLVSYTASKFAIRGMTKTAAMEFGHYGIRVNSVHPGGINTVMGNPMAMSEEQMNTFIYSRQPIPRIGRPEEVANVVLFLASDEASFCTGSEYMVDGGWLAGHIEPGLPGSLMSTPGMGYNT
jgi:3alpha(or 20beta)-hydroxysteroid dehydrogenase